MDRRRDARRRLRAARDRRLRQARVAELEADLRDRHAERVGGDLRHHGVGAGAEVLRGRADDDAAVGQQAHQRLGGAAVGRIGGGRHAAADAPATVAHRRRQRRAPLPAEALGAEAVALAQRLARVRPVLARILLGVVAQPQLERIDLQREGELVHRALEREIAGRLARRAREGRRRDVELGDAVGREVVRAGVEMACRQRRVLGQVLEHRGLGDRLVRDRREPAVAIAAERERLLGLRAVADRAEHLRPLEHELDRPADGLGRPARRARRATRPSPCSRSRRRRTDRSRARSRARCRRSSPASCARRRRSGSRRTASVDRRSSRRWSRAAPSGCGARSASCRSRRPSSPRCAMPAARSPRWWSVGSRLARSGANARALAAREVELRARPARS